MDSRAGHLKNLKPHLLPAAIFAALALAVTWPLWQPVGQSAVIQSYGDPLLNSWILWWDRFALFHQATAFFDANVFWPNADALAYGEHLLAPALMTLPFAPLVDHPAALHNLSVVQAYFFSALAAYALAWRYFRTPLPATAAGLAYGFAAYRLAQVGHIQLAHGEFLPLMVLGFELALDRPSGRGPKALLAAAALGQWLTSWYWAVFSFWCLAPYFAVRLWHRRSELDARRVMAVLAPLIIAAILTLPMALPYAKLKKKNVLIRPPEASAGFAATPRDFATPPPRQLLWGWIGERPEKFEGTNANGPSVRRPNAERALFPGLAVCLALAFGLSAAVRRRPAMESDAKISPDVELPLSARFPLRLWLAIALGLMAFCFGDRLRFDPQSDSGFPMPLALVNAFFPFAEGMRVPARWMLPATLPLALMVGFVVAQLGARAANTRSAEGRSGQTGEASRFPATVPIIISYAFIALLVLESLARPVPTQGLPAGPREVDLWLRDQTFPSPVAEWPLRADDDNQPMLHAAWHRQPLAGGTNGVFPPGYRSLMRKLDRLETPQGLAAARELRIKYIVFAATSPGVAGVSGAGGASSSPESVTRDFLLRSPSTYQAGGYRVVDIEEIERAQTQRVR